MSQPRALPPEFTIYAVAGLRQEWLSWLPDVSTAKRAADDAPEPWPVDAAAVAELDAAGVQMLVALSRSVAACGKSLVLTDPSPTLVRGCEALGLADLLGRGDAPGAAA
jgi:anti-anti-sigma regulatory factor